MPGADSVVGTLYAPMATIEIEVGIGPSVRYRVLITDEYGTRTDFGLRSTIESTKSVSIRFANPVCLEEAESEVGALCRLLGVIAGQDLGFCSLRFFGKSLPSKCSMHFAPIGKMGARDLPILTWPELQTAMSVILSTWAVREPEIRLAVDYFVSSRPDRPGYLEDRLFAAFAAIDALHRVVHQKKSAKKRQWRLIPLLSHFSLDIAGDYLNWATESKDRMVRLRNDLAHGHRSMTPPLGKEEAVGILWKLRSIIWSLLLARLGVPTPLILKGRAAIPGRV